ncbi:U3 snoRNP-associated protein-like YAOH [Iris pallida]|uniref:U3 snoRNP-associated protein-like YAOH n=1 Tax=Iris pallida TaxID=29817 RepID=A0AAX6GUV5_IRIPA|nr:U3 snoRNP-associated protein-like YAOH [Iris pallida]
MKYQNKKKSRPKKNPKSSSNNNDPFFEPTPKRRKKVAAADEDLESLPSDDDDAGGSQAGAVVVGEEEEEEAGETAAEVKYRIAREYLERIQKETKRIEEEDEEYGEEDREERDGGRDSLVAEFLKKSQLEESGRVPKIFASRILNPEPLDEFRPLVKHRQSVTSVTLSEDDTRGFSASKDGYIVHWDVESGKSEKYLWPSEDILISHHAKAPQNPSAKRSKHVLALAISPDGRYLATGGLDRHVHLWDTRTREHIQAFHGHRGPVSCLTFRQGTPQLFSGSFDRQIKLWNVEDRTHMDTLHGHQSEILTIDCLRKEQILTAGRDRTVQLYKVADGKRLLFRAPSSSECCCFINDSEFLSGSDDGSIEHWSVLRKKPTHITKNAHSLLLNDDQSPKENKEEVPNGYKKENGFGKVVGCSSAQSWVSSVAVCRGSDLAASGAGNGVVRLWAIRSDDRRIQPLFNYPVVGFVNSLTFAKSGRFLLAGVGQEPRLGRWGRISNARNGVAIHPVRIKE